jgi:hypothetical protein
MAAVSEAPMAQAPVVVVAVKVVAKVAAKAVAEATDLAHGLFAQPMKA